MKRLLIFLIGLAGIANAHNMPGSSVLLDFQRDSVEAELILPLQELELGFKRPLLDDPATVVTRYEAELKSYITDHVQPVSGDGRSWVVEVGELKLQLAEAPFDLIARAHMTPPAGASTRKFRFNYSVINHEVMSHHATVAVRSDWDTAVFSSKPEPLGMLQFVVTFLDIDRSTGSWTQGFRSVFRHGMQHISEGTDHLLFLLVLLLPAPLLADGNRWGRHSGLRTTLGRLLKVVTAFTLGHSLTLLVGGLGWVRLPPQPVEVMIAISILISAIHAVRPVFAGKEVFIAAGFGLVHGLAFASTLEEYGFSHWYMVLTILAFNLGIEAMQLFVVACIVPWLVILSRTGAYASVRWAGAIFAAVAASGWIAERAFSWPNAVGPVVEAIASRAWLVIGVFALMAVATHLWEKAVGGKDVVPSAP